MAKKTAGAAKLTIYQKIRRDIINGLKKPGERLSIEQLKQEFGTSVTPVRDALQMLSQEDLITIKPRSGYYVTRTTLKELNDMIELRAILETAAVERAAERISDEQIKALEKLHQGFTDSSENASIRYTDENRKFHYLVAQASGNQELASQVAHIHDRLVRFMVMSNPGWEMETIHGKLIDRLKARDPQGAVKAIQKELNHGKEKIMERIMQEEASSWHLGSASLSN